MQLESLTIENIASLKGRHHISFNELRDSSQIFAITGPTGSGKSTILSSISLALFGTSIKNNLNASDYVTLGQAQGSIHLNFSIGQKQYVSHWQCILKKKNGELRSKPKITRLLRDVSTGEDLDLKELIDLDLHQFNKVAILHQGRFADFLHATFTERKKLLETLIGDKTLSSIGKNLNTVLNHYSNKISILNSSCDNTDIIDATEKKKLEERITELKTLVSNKKEDTQCLKNIVIICEKFLDNTRKQPSLHKRIKDEEKELSHINKVLTTAKAEEELKQSKYFEITKDYEKEKPRLEVAIKKKEEIEKIAREIEKITVDKDSKAKSLNEWIQELKQIELEKEKPLTDFLLYSREDQNLNIGSIHSTIESYQKAEDILDQKILHTQTLKEIETTLNNLAIKIEKKENDLQKVFLQLDIESKKIINEDLLDTYIEKLNLLNSNFKEYIQKQTLITNLKQSITEREEILQSNNEKLTIYSKQRAELDGQLKKYQNLLRESEFNRLIKELREEIIDNDLNECPVCLSDITSINNLKADIRSNDKDKSDSLVQKLKCELESTVNTIDTITRDNESLIKDITKSKKELTTHSKFVNNYKNIEKDIESTQNAIKSVEGYNQSKKIFKTSLNDLIGEKNKLASRKEQLTVLIKTLINELEQNKIDEGFNKKNIKDKIDHYKKLVELKNTLSRLKLRTERVNKQKSVIKIELENTETKLQDAKTSKLKLLEEYKQNDYPLNPHTDLESIRDLKDMHGTALQKAQMNRRENEFLEQKKVSLIRSLKEQNEDIERLKIKYLSETTNTIKENSTYIDDEQIIKLLDSYKLDYKEQFQVTALETLFNDYLSVKYEEGSLYLEEIQAEYTQISTILDEQKKQQEKQQQILQQIKTLEVEFKEFEKLEYFIGKDKFRDYALSVVEKNLVNLANEEIKTFAGGRYLLLHTKEGRASEFSIVDKWQGHKTRKISTLSGGETFMLSLALALALSRINSGSQEIGFFLIDEGFGSLDQDSIDEVMECLMNLHARGKQIGLISHIKELTTRIPTCIELTKNQWGESHMTTSL